MKNIKKTTLQVALIFAALVSCEKVDSELDYGFNKVYMPQSINFSQGQSTVYPVPRGANGNSPGSFNYLRDVEKGQINILLGVSLSGKATSGYRVSVETSAEAAAGYARGKEHYKVMDNAMYTLPSEVEAQESGTASFYLTLSNELLFANRGKHLVLAVRVADLRGPENYEIDPALSTTIVDVDVEGFFPTFSKASAIDLMEVEGKQLTISGTNLNLINRVKFTSTEIELPVVAKGAAFIQVSIPGLDGIPASGSMDLISDFSTLTTPVEFINTKKGSPLFTDEFGPGISALPNGGVDYASTKQITTGESKRGNASLAISMRDYSPFGFIHRNGFVNDGYKYLVFWAKAVPFADWSSIPLLFNADGRPAGTNWQGIQMQGYGNWDFRTRSEVPTDSQWHFIVIPIGASSSLPLWSIGNTFSRLGWYADGANTTIYFDEIMFVK